MIPGMPLQSVSCKISDINLIGSTMHLPLTKAD